ncbi:hypothetical protein MTO96_013701 [Rhipicephalus appendiculatus]
MNRQLRRNWTQGATKDLRLKRLVQEGETTLGGRDGANVLRMSSCLDASSYPEKRTVAANEVLHPLLLIKRSRWISRFLTVASGRWPDGTLLVFPRNARGWLTTTRLRRPEPRHRSKRKLKAAKTLPASRKGKTLTTGGWFTATYHNSRLIAVPETGAEAVDKSAPSQPKQKGNPFRKEKLPPLPKTDFKVIIRPRDGLNISQLSTHQMARAITKACGNPDICNEGNLLIRLRNGSNIATISTPSIETANVVQSLPSLRFGAKDYAVMAYVAAPDNSCKGVIHGLDAGTTPTELLAHLRAPETKKKQQKKPIAKKEDDGTVSRKAPFFSASSTAPKNTNTQTIMVGNTGNAPPNEEVKELRQTIQTLRAENAELRQKLNELIDELKALRTGQTNANSQADVTLSATVGRQEFTSTMASINNALANLSNLISNIQDEARKDRERLVQLTGMKSRGKPYARPSAEYGEQP